MTKYKILFLEDQETIRETLTEYLKEYKYEVVEAEDGEIALNLLKTEKFDLAILDIMVPKISGLEVLEQIDKNDLKMGRIMLTALDDDNTQVEAFSKKADDFITKPINPKLLLMRVESVLRRINDEGKTRKTQGLFLDEKSYIAFFDGVDLKLTLTEFLLLKVLRNRPNQVFTRDQLINLVFSEDYICNDRVIDSHIKNLRKKLPVNCIKTIIGLGYRYEA